MLVAVLMSTYNGKEFLGKQIESIILQKGVDIKLLVRDDGSNDNTQFILEQKKNEGVLSWFTGENLKPALSFMELIRKAPEADYYAFSDQDDIWDEDKLITAVDFLKNYDNIPAYYYCNARLIDRYGEKCGGTVYKENDDLNEQNIFHYLCCGGCMGCTMVLNKKLVAILKSAARPKSIIMHDFFIQAVCASVGGKAIYDNQAHMGYRQHESNVVGRGVGYWNAITYRIGFLLSRRDISIADQSNDILKLYSKFIPEVNKAYLECIANYKNKIKNRLMLTFEPRIKYKNKLNECFIRLSLLLGKR
ncbi:glycosyltransferase [Butyrivibrio sp. AE3004]|uniref:glycosyltransferase n=1 Tax=Butyrivibrio sp. AE3004 TaxID=1506994 RepID=UPI00068D91AE|nr:glycosyltransferase [Butyrivibrio sp. AE3004]